MNLRRQSWVCAVLNLDVALRKANHEIRSAKCIDTYISISASQQRLGGEPSKVQPDELNDAFSSAATGSASTAASQAATTTPFSQSALPSKSLLSREGQDSEDLTAVAEDPTPIQLPPGTQKKLHAVIRRLFERCFEEGLYRQVVGISVEARNLETLRETVVRAGGKNNSSRREELMDYMLDICMNVVQERGLRNDILQLILDLLLSDQVTSPDYFAIAKCMVYLGQNTMAANLLKQLVEQDNPNALAVAYQVSFDLHDNGSQDFLQKIVDELPQTEEVRVPTSPGSRSWPDNFSWPDAHISNLGQIRVLHPQWSCHPTESKHGKLGVRLASVSSGR